MMWKKILKHKEVSLMSLAALLFVMGGALWSRLALHITALSSPVILHYNDLEGITAVGTPANFVFIAAFGIAAVIMNFVIALELEERSRFLGKCAAAVTLVLAILLFIGFAAIISVN